MASHSLRIASTFIVASLGLSACDGAQSGTKGGTPIPGAAAFEVDQQAFNQLKARAELAGALDAPGAKQQYAVKFRTQLSYDPLSSQHLDKIQASALALNSGEQNRLKQDGFAIAKGRAFPTFLTGLAAIYSEHLPVYISADAILESVHSSYETMLGSLEVNGLVPNLRALLSGMRQRLAAVPAARAGRVDADLYLALALSLLEGKPVAPVAGASAARVGELLAKANAADGTDRVILFGMERDEDFSQFKPRGHYTQREDLSQYFRAMIWLGRIDLRLIETLPDGAQVFRRAQYDAMLLLRELIGPDLEIWRTIDDAVRTFVGESDYMTVTQVDALANDLGGQPAAQSASDDAVVTAIGRGGYGRQQIASHLMVNGTNETLPLNRSFALFGQRYVVDSHVFSEVVYDRIKQKRMMPDPLEAAFAALGNNQALGLDPDLEKFKELPGALSRMRVLVDAHDDEFWSANFYNLWLSALRALSPAADLSDPRAQGKPEVTGSDAWGRRILNAQLGSWAELRHDTLLYAKQSYTGIPACDYPDAYVDPYPEVFAAVRKYAEQGSRIAEIAQRTGNEFLSDGITKYFAGLRVAASHLEGMARAQQTGNPLSPEQLAFIKDAVRIERESAGCTTIEVPDGWYADLFYQRDKSIEFDPTIADVHTQPADEAGNPVGRVLHVGTGYPRLMVVTVDTCMGPRAYAGVVYAYHELVTEKFKRLTDEDWAQSLRSKDASIKDPSWLAPLLGP